MIDRAMREKLRELVRELREKARAIQANVDDPHQPNPMYRGGLHGGLQIAIEKIKDKFGMKI
jgi:hypothetical protein